VNRAVALKSRPEEVKEMKKASPLSVTPQALQVTFSFFEV
jgi:hypothetical protein